MKFQTELKEFDLSLRERLYSDVCDCLEGITDGGKPAIEYFDLFNNQFAHLKEETVMKYPCVLVEFPAIEWTPRGGGAQQATLKMTLYVAQNMTNRKTFRLRRVDNHERNTAYLRLLDAIHRQLSALRLPYAGTIRRISSVTDHDHDHLIVCVENYSMVCTDTSGVLPTVKTKGGAASVDVV